MAGGIGERMLPITCEIPKPMMPIMNIPLLEHTILLLKENGIKDIGITLMYLSDVIKNYFLDGAKWGVHITYFTETVPLGTAGSVLNASSFYNDTFVVISGDCITDFDILKAVEFHKNKKALATMVLKKVKNPVNFGIASVDRSGVVRRFCEKPGSNEIFSNSANTGIYVLEPSVFEYINPKRPLDFSMDVFPLLIQNKLPLIGYNMCKYWSDVGSPISYIDTHKDILDQKVKIHIKNSINGGNIFIGKSTVIEPTAIIYGPCVIGESSYIGKDVVIGKHTVIGNNCIINDKASVKGCIIFDNSIIGYRSKLIGSVLGKKVHLMGNVSSYQNVIIGDKSTIYDYAVIKPNIKIWPGKTIASMSVIDKNIA